MNVLTKWFLLLVILMTVSACGKEEQNGDGNEKEYALEQSDAVESEKKTKAKAKEGEMEVDPLPTTYEELAALPVGKLADFHPDTANPEPTLEAFKDLPDILSNPTQKELDYFYRELLKLAQDDFKGPEDLIKQMRFQAIGNPEIEDSRYHFKENLNVEIILDASGSMAQSAGDKIKMQAAKDSITQFVKQLPQGAKVGLRVYGHKGSNADSDMPLSCSSSDIVYSISPMDEGQFQDCSPFRSADWLDANWIGSS